MKRALVNLQGKVVGSAINWRSSYILNNDEVQILDAKNNVVNKLKFDATPIMIYESKDGFVITYRFDNKCETKIYFTRSNIFVKLTDWYKEMEDEPNIFSFQLIDNDIIISEKDGRTTRVPLHD